MSTVRKEKSLEQILANIREHVHDLTGVSDTRGIELFSAINIVAHCLESAGNQHFEAMGLSGQRWAILMRLLGEERHGKNKALTPSDLARFHNVSKNTISALLRGLEEQELIERTLDAVDKRLFHIRLSEAGRKLVTETYPQQMKHLNDLVSELSEEEEKQLIVLMGKLFHSLQMHATFHRHAGEEEPTDD